MNEVIYLEADSEVTAVIDRIKRVGSEGVVLALPRGSTLAHSIVNLKLLKRAAESIGKFIIIVANDKIAGNLARQVNLPFYSKVSEAQNIKAPSKREKPVSAEENEEDFGSEIKSSIKVRTYNRFSSELNNDDEKAADDLAEPEIEEKIEENGSKLVFDDEMEETDLPLNDDKEEEMVGLKHSKMAFEEITPEQKRKFDSEIEETLKHVPAEKKAEPKASFPEKDDDPKIERKQNSDKQSENIKPFQAKVQPEKRGKSKLALIISIVGIVLFVAAAGAAYLLIPRAQASIIIKTEDYDKTVELTIDKTVSAIDSEKMVIPGIISSNEKEVTKKFPATGKKDIGEKASGTLSIYNLTSEKLGLPAGTKFTTSDGKIFTLLTAATLPASTEATSVADCKKDAEGKYDCTIPGVLTDQKVSASNTGEKYNIVASRFSVGSFSGTKVYAESKSAFSGGTTKEVAVVTESDLIAAEKAAKEEVFAASKDELIKSVDAAKVRLIEESIDQDVISETASKKAAEEASEFEYTVKAKTEALGFSEENLRDLVMQSIGKTLPTGKMLINSNEGKIEYEIAEPDINAGTAKISVKYVGKVGDQMSAEPVKSLIKNKKLSAARQIISQMEGVEDAEVKVWPNFVPMMPYLTRNISVKFDFAK